MRKRTIGRQGVLRRRFGKVSFWLRRFRISARLSVSMVITALVPVLVIGGYSYSIARQSIYEKISSYSTQIADQVNMDTARYASDLLSASETIAYSDYIQQALVEYAKNGKETDYSIPENIVNYVRNNISQSMSISDIRIVTSGGDLIHYKWLYLLKPDEMAKLQALERNHNGLPAFAPVNLESGHTGISLVRGIFSTKNFGQIGEIYLTADERGLADIYRNIDLGPGASIGIFDGQGDMLSSNVGSGAKADPHALLADIKRARKQGISAASGAFTDRGNLVTFSHIESVDWYVVCRIPLAYLNAASNHIGEYIFFVSIACIFVCLLLALLINGSIERPLSQLSSHMKRAKDGALPAKVVDPSHDEIADVTNSFNDMIDEIGSLVDNIREVERQRASEKIKVLQAQINPHFLSNTLNTVKWMATIQHADNISSLITSLIQLMQVSMGKVSELVTLATEVDYVRNYVNIQSYKYCDKFEVFYDIDPAVQNCLLPPFTLQPIVENAIIHGIEPKDGQGSIWISAARVGGEVICTVTDNGVGMPPEGGAEAEENGQPNRPARQFSGIGIRSVDERVKFIFGPLYGVSSESVPGIFTKIRIRFPFPTPDSPKG